MRKQKLYLPAQSAATVPEMLVAQLAAKEQTQNASSAQVSFSALKKTLRADAEDNIYLLMSLTYAKTATHPFLMTFCG